MLQRVLPEFYEYGMGTLIWHVLYVCMYVCTILCMHMHVQGSHSFIRTYVDTYVGIPMYVLYIRTYVA